MTRRRLWLLPVAGAVAVALVACGGGGGTNTTSRTVASTGIVTKVTTNVPEINQVLNTALSGDNIEMARLTGYQRIPCAATPSGNPPPPLCRSTEAEGTPVEVFAQIGCDGNVTWIRPEDVPDGYKAALGASDTQLEAVYATTAFAARYESQYVAVIKNPKREDGSSGSTAVYLHNGRIVALEDDCGNPARLIGNERVAAFVVPPTATAGTPAPTP